MRIEYEESESPGGAVQPRPEIKISNTNVLEEKKQELWKKLTTEETGEAAPKPITKAEVAKPREASAPPPLPDRALVAPDLKKFLSTREETRNPFEEQAGRIEEALRQIADPGEELPPEQLMLQRLESIETRLLQREAEEARQREVEAYERSIEDFKSKVVGFIDARAEDYPGIVALGRQEAAFDALLSLTQQGQDLSEEDVASHMEAQLRSDYEALQAVYKPSKATNTSDKPKTKTASVMPDPDGNTYGHTVDKIANLKDAQQALWDRLQRSA
jgi:hypothetical protein